MKLRSGKKLKPLPQKLSTLDKLDIKLEYMLEDFRSATLENPQHARELLDIISECTHSSDRFKVWNKTVELYDNNGVPSAVWIVGNLFSLITHQYPRYHDFIEDRIKSFDLEASLIGDIES